MKISIIMPVYNEEKTILEIVQKVLAVKLDKELIIVDDGSTDSTRHLLKQLEHEPGVTIILKNKNEGKGATLQEGFRHVKGDIVIIQDADLEYDPSDYKKLIEPIEQNIADVVFGSRFLGYPRKVLFFWHTLGNKFLTLCSNILHNINLTDMETCYKVFRASILKELKFVSRRFGFEPEFTAKVARKRYRIYEVPVSYHGRGYNEGKKITWKDGLAAFYWIVYFRFKP
ncbi:MAG: glycosyl transferase [Candidatus Fischerbacteria bacterium RBG_13_37_8]|uniref:Glycosyl transferase n=1 Tax=Candidatus Fischerbacteria bacterium RBG_13_37_8 TaxID=1817863 RepID=A0A1F5VTP7_9BACT|nr:MAG: glycosyl transferase [Candidatus Fischerbacteria bacterium RBG_13_37_8]